MAKLPWLPRGKNREEDARRALIALGTARFERFLRAAVRAPWPRSSRYFVEALDRGESIESLLFDGQKHGYFLVAKRLGRLRFRITFGFSCPPELEAGDGATSDVTFDDDGNVATLESGIGWIV